MRLDRVLAAVEVLDLEGDPAIDVTDVTYSSASVRPGSLFCCLPGSRVDGHDFAPAAVEAGASALLVEHFVGNLPGRATQARVEDARRAMGLAAAAIHGDPSRRLQVVGVTGTNGKSTTTLLLQAIFNASGRPCGVIGTLNSARTTPESPDLQAALAAFVADGLAAAAIEVSSVGLAQRRLAGTDFAAGVFTNLSVDELTIHGSMEGYFRAKALLFDPDLIGFGVVNADDPYGRRILDERAAEVPLKAYRLADAAGLEVEVGRSRFRWEGALVELPLDAEFNVLNALAALTTARELGIDPEVAARALSSLEPIEGHGEVVDAGQPFRVVVDFAHTAGALAAVLRASRRAAWPDGRVIAVFGCGGDRDTGRRAPMGEAAAQNADVVIVTSDNPRTEDPLAIIDAVVSGARDAHPRDLRTCPDRRGAIEMAIAEAQEGDVVVIAGKGHETGQIIGTEVVPFDDRDVARAVLATRGYGAAPA